VGGTSLWTLHWRATKQPDERYVVDEFIDVPAALASVIAVAEGRSEPRVAPRFAAMTAADSERPTVAAPAVDRPSASTPAAKAPPPPSPRSPPLPPLRVARAPAARPTGDWLALDMGRVDSGSTVGFLIVLRGRRQGEVLRVEGPGMLIGHAPECDLCFPDDPGVGRVHATLAVADDASVTLEAHPGCDVLVNGQGTLPRALEEGDVVRLGATCLVRFTRELPEPGGGRPQLLN
jgi:hypothetical protein